MSGRGEPAARRKPVVLMAALGGAVFLAACSQIGMVEPNVVVPDGDPIVGRALIETYACMTCHAIPGVRGPQASVGPPLNDWAERGYIAGNLPNTLANLVDWIVNPQAIEPGTVMPTLGVTPEEARDIAAYLYELTD